MATHTQRVEQRQSRPKRQPGTETASSPTASSTAASSPTASSRVKFEIEKLAREGTLSAAGLLDLSADVAAMHPELRGSSHEIRNQLAVRALQRQIATELAGEPQLIIDGADSPTGDIHLQQAKLLGEAQRRIWQEPMLTSSAAAESLGAKPENREKVSALRKRSKLIGLPRGQGRQYLYPAFQFDPERQDLYPQVVEVNQILEAVNDPWGVASWWLQENSWLEARPVDLLGTDKASEIEQAARALLSPVG